MNVKAEVIKIMVGFLTERETLLSQAENGQFINGIPKYRASEQTPLGEVTVRLSNKDSSKDNLQVDATQTIKVHTLPKDIQKDMRLLANKINHHLNNKATTKQNLDSLKVYNIQKRAKMNEESGEVTLPKEDYLWLWKQVKTLQELNSILTKEKELGNEETTSIERILEHIAKEW